MEMNNDPSNSAQQGPLESVQLPECQPPSLQWCKDLEKILHKASWTGVQATQQVLPPNILQAIVLAVTPILDKEPTLIEIQPSNTQQRVTVVGDTHGQYHDVCRMFETYGYPSKDRIYIFNGDYVDRGAWGVETLTLLLVWKWLLPHNVYLLRGNHETALITRIYGFYAELKAKYGAAGKGLFTLIRRMFACLPLAALVEGSTLILHGGLFRAPPKKGKGSKRRRSSGVRALTVGTLDDLRQAAKGGQDPDPERSIKCTIASDVMWSDPVNTPGLRHNEARGCGTVYGPDVTQSFLAANGLKLIIRSHEGPDARDRREGVDVMPSVDSGYAVDHTGQNGSLVTLFSAPDYPQFMAEGEARHHNKGAVLHLSAPDYATPAVESFEAVLPRPQVESYYDVPGLSEDEEEDEGLTQHSEGEHAAGNGSSAATDALPAAALPAAALPATALPAAADATAAAPAPDEGTAKLAATTAAARNADGSAAASTEAAPAAVTSESIGATPTALHEQMSGTCSTGIATTEQQPYEQQPCQQPCEQQQQQQCGQQQPAGAHKPAGVGALEKAAAAAVGSDPSESCSDTAGDERPAKRYKPEQSAS